MPDLPDRCLELVDGVMRENPLMGVFSAHVLMNTLRTLGRFVGEHDMGITLPGLGCVLKRDPDTVRLVGISYFDWDRVPEGEPSDFFWEEAPTLAVEVVTPNDLAEDFQQRIYDYLEAETQDVWVLWPMRQSMTIYRTNANTREFDPDSTLDGGSLLPGFSVRVGDLFEVPHRPGC